MSALNPDFLKVLPVDNERVGPLAAQVLALMRYATALPNGRDRLTIDGEVWWRASYTEIAESLRGVKRDSVWRVVTKLESDGELLSLQPRIGDGDRMKAYRIPPDQAFRENAKPLTSHFAESRGGVAESRQGYRENATSIPYRELGRNEEGALRGAHTDALRAEALRLIGDCWPKDLGSVVVGIAATIVRRYLADGPDDPQRRDTIREALALCPPERTRHLNGYISTAVRARHAALDGETLCRICGQHPALGDEEAGSQAEMLCRFCVEWLTRTAPEGARDCG